MTIPRKPDSAEIKQHLQELKSAKWLGHQQKWWPGHLFRFDHIENAARILNSGNLFSRESALQQGIMAIDSASSAIIAGTSSRWKSYARLYFRPLSPMQFQCEGFRRKDQYPYGACCPAPVVIVFSAEDILTRKDTFFSNGNLASNATTGGDAAFLKSIPFQKVYHNIYFEGSEKSEIIFHRHAEVIVPDELELSPLRFVGCRTQAEYETLLHLLTPNSKKKWSSIIGLGTKLDLHLRRWTFVERADFSKSHIRFVFNKSTQTPGPFNVSVQIVEHGTGVRYIWKDDSYMANGSLTLNLESLSNPDNYNVRLDLDGYLAYINDFQGIDVPV